ncbi:TIGR00341 family protein [halophilic archaeon]|nr:TIGR00341 family protein [halophilic archaeon]
MRLVEVMAMSEKARTETVAFLEEEGLEYTVSDDTRDADATARISFPVSAHRVESVQTGLTERDIAGDIYTVVDNPETIVSARFDDGGEEAAGARVASYQRVSRSELHSKAADLIPNAVVYTLLTAISAIVATAGVLLESRSVMVGSMVIAPLLGPSMATSVSTVIDDRDLFATSVRYQLTGTAIAVASAVGFALLVRYAGVGRDGFDVTEVLEVSSHTSPTMLLVAVALCAGVAGAVSLSTSGVTSLVGVMIAAAVMPPLGITGVGVAWLRPVVVAGSLAVVLLNVLAINLGATITLWYFGYHPRNWSDLQKTRSVMLRRTLVAITVIGALVLFLTELPASGLSIHV